MKLRFTEWSVMAVLMAVLLVAGCGSQANEALSEPDARSQVSTETPEAAGSSDATQSMEEEGSAAEVERAYHHVLEELNKASEGQEVDFTQVQQTYEKQLQAFVIASDLRNEGTDQQITAALQSGASGELEPEVVKQLFDKLVQKAFFYNIRATFAEVTESWDNSEKVEAAFVHAQQLYSVLQGTVEKRDAAYSTNLVATIDGAFQEMDSAIEAGDLLEFQLAQQVIDKSLMKTFYLAVGGSNGYVYKIEQSVEEGDLEKAKVQQAEAWAFYQSLHGYLAGSAPDEAEQILEMLDLSTDVSSIDGHVLNQDFVKGLIKVALHEYEESFESKEENKAVITALEGALFIDMVGLDLQEELGEETYQNLLENAQTLTNHVKAGNQEETQAVFKEIEPVLQGIAEQSSYSPMRTFS